VIHANKHATCYVRRWGWRVRMHTPNKMQIAPVRFPRPDPARLQPTNQLTLPVKQNRLLLAAEAADATGNKSKGNFMLPQNRGAINSPTPIYANGRVIGQVVGDTFRKIISGSKHMLRTPKAICFDRSTLRDAVAAGA